MPLQRIPINNFRGGLNTRDGPFDLQENESPDLLNVTLTDLVGALQVRQGKTRFDSNSPAHTIDYAKQVVLGTGIRFLMCSINGSIYSCDPAGAFVLRFTGTVGTVWTFEQAADAANVDHVWCLNQTDAPQKWDGVAGTTAAWNGTPPNGTQMILWRNRLVITGVAAQPQRAYFSQGGDPEATIDPYDIEDFRGDEDELDWIVESNVLGDRLYLFKQRSVWVVSDAATLANRRLGGPGCFSRFQSCVSEDKLYWLNEQGIWSTGGVEVEYESGSISALWPDRVNVSALQKARILGTRDSYPRILVALPVDGSTVNNIMLELVPHINFRRIGGRRYLLLPAFMLHSYAPSCLANFNPNFQWIVVGGDTGVNKLYRYFNGASDDGAEILAHWQSSWMSIEGEEPYERIRRLNVELSGDAIVDVFKDFNTQPDFSATLPSGGDDSDTLWDGGVWDGGRWDPISTYRFVRVRPESRGRFHSIRFRSLPGGVPFLINVAELSIRGGKEH